MRFTDIFIRRPVLAICVNLLIVIAGFQAVRSLPTRQYPRSDMAVIKVQTAYIGASADLVRGFVTTPLERVIASADGIDYLTSSSVQGLSTIDAHLKLNYNTSEALTQVQAKVAQVRNELPPEAESPVIDVETTDNRFASMYLSFYSDVLERNEITDYLTRVVQPKLSSVLGVQKAEILGARTFAMRVWLMPERMAAMQISPAQVIKALQANNYLAALGATKGSMVSINLTANTNLENVQEFQRLVVKRDGDTLVHLGDIANVELGAESYDADVRFSGQRATFMGVWVLPNANSLEVIKNIRKLLPEIGANLPQGMKYGIPHDGTEYIHDAIREVLKTLSETVFIVIVVIFIFVGSIRSVLVPVVAIPLSLIGGVALIMLFGFSINLLTLLAIVLAVGLVVDDAIVMLENVERHVQQGMNSFDAAIVAARELVNPIIVMTLTLAAVYAPIGIQGGLTGALFKEFAFTLAGAVLVSGFVALTLSPMMSARLVHFESDEKAFKSRVERTFGRLKNFYERILRVSLSYRIAIITSSVMIMFLMFPFYMFSMKELAPSEDQGILFSIVQAAPDSSIEQTLRYVGMVGEAFASFPEYFASFQITFPSGGFAGMVTKPWSERKRTTMDIMPDAWKKTGQIPGVRVIVTNPPPLPGGANFPVEFVISSTDEPERLNEYAQELVKAAFASKMFMFADADLKIDLPQTELVIDREKVAAMGLDLATVGRELSLYTGGNYINRFSIQGQSYKVIPQAERSARLNPEQLGMMYVSAPNGGLIPLSSVVQFKEKVAPRELKKFQQLNSVTVQGAIAPGVTLDSALAALESKAKEILPAGVEIDYAGESRQLRKEGSAMLTTLLFATVMIYLVLAAQFESFRDPFIILAGSVPLALAGSLLFSFLGFTTMNIYSQVGLVTLVGLVSKNGILIVEFANVLREKGLSKMEAVVQASATRLRPILMTSVATVVGHFPLVIAQGAGAQARNSIGIMLVSGMIIGTVFTLFVVPAIYLLVSGKRNVREGL